MGLRGLWLPGSLPSLDVSLRGLPSCVFPAFLRLFDLPAAAAAAHFLRGVPRGLLRHAWESVLIQTEIPGNKISPVQTCIFLVLVRPSRLPARTFEVEESSLVEEEACFLAAIGRHGSPLFCKAGQLATGEGRAFAARLKKWCAQAAERIAAGIRLSTFCPIGVVGGPLIAAS